MIEIQWNPSRRDLRLFGLIGLPIPMLGLAALAHFRLGWVAVPAGLAAVAAGGLLLGAVAPALLRPLYVGISVAGYPVGWLVSHALLAALFYLVVTPTGLILRAAGRDPLDRDRDRPRDSHWRPRPPARPPADYFRQY